MTEVVALCLRSRAASVVCLGVVIAALFLPPEGPGLPLCSFKWLTGLPCFACGMTRSFIGMAHLDPARAAFYHPLGLFLFPMVAATAVLLLAPRRYRESLAARAEERRRLLGRFGFLLLGIFLAHGAARIAWVVAFRQPSPW